MPCILIEADSCHKAYAAFCIVAHLYLQHETAIAIKKSGNVRSVEIESTSHGIIISFISVLKRIWCTWTCAHHIHRTEDDVDFTVISRVGITDLSVK